LVERIVITADKIYVNARFPELLHPLEEMELSGQATDIRVKDITGNQQKVHLLRQAQLNQPVKSRECGIAQFVSKSFVPLGKPLKRGVKVKIGCVNESKNKAVDLMIPEYSEMLSFC
jgi:hypothetical protein